MNLGDEETADEVNTSFWETQKIPYSKPEGLAGILDHDAVIKSFIAANPEWRRTGMMQAIRKHAGGWLDHLNDVGFITDAYRLDASNPELPLLHILEVEKHSELGTKKKSRLAQVWWELDCLGWNLEMTIYNIERQSWTYISDYALCRMYYDLIVYPKNRERQALRFEETT